MRCKEVRNSEEDSEEKEERTKSNQQVVSNKQQATTNDTRRQIQVRKDSTVSYTVSSSAACPFHSLTCPPLSNAPALDSEYEG